MTMGPTGTDGQRTDDDDDDGTDDRTDGRTEDHNGVDDETDGRTDGQRTDDDGTDDGTLLLSTQSRKNKKGLAAAFHCSLALAPWSKGGASTLGRADANCKEMLLPVIFYASEIERKK